MKKNLFQITIKIAWRNILRHKGKSLVIGVILLLGSLIMTVGNGIITGMNKGIEENIVNSFTGDIILISEKQREEAVILSPTGAPIEVIAGYPKIKAFLNNADYIDRFLPVAIGAAMLLNEEGEPDFNFLLGTDFKSYQKMFPNNMVAIEGRLLKPGERGMLLTQLTRDLNYDYLLGYWIKPENTELVKENLNLGAAEEKDELKVKDHMIFMGFSEKNTTLDILAKVKGVIKYNALNKILGYFNILDIESFRECFGYFTAEDNLSSISKQNQDLLVFDSFDSQDLFGDSGVLTDVEMSDEAFSVNELKKVTKRKHKSFDVDKGSYNQIFIKLKPHIPLDQGLAQINKELKAEKLPVRAISWKQGLGDIADMAMLMKGSLFIFVMLIFFVAIIVIMNTLSMAAIERIPEIGMMRAVGARKKFISYMFLYETWILSLIFGGSGIVLGTILIKVLSVLKFSTDNEMLQLLYGGDTFHPFLGGVDILLVIIQLALVTLLAAVYPVIVARRITPLDAIARD
ncbi:ABC transporter permease [Candidatus Margulisiibacteriota bacterium]